MEAMQVAQLVGRIAMGDNRQVDHATLQFWNDHVGDLDFTDACEAVRRHRMNSTDYLQPAHVRRGVTAIRSERVDKNLKAIPPYPDPDDVAGALEWERQWRKRLADGEVPPPPPALPSRPMPLIENLIDSPPTRSSDGRKRGPRSVKCAWCKAEPGEPCLVNGKPANWFHEARKEAAA